MVTSVTVTTILHLYLFVIKSQYKHLIGSEEEFKVAKKAEANSDRSFGMVSAESKKDRRTVEQVYSYTLGIFYCYNYLISSKLDPNTTWRPIIMFC